MKKLIIILLLSPIVSLSQGLVASYPFSGNADASGVGNNGIVNGAVLTTDRFGIPNSAYLFDGDDYIDFGTGYSYSSHTFSLWARRDSAVNNQVLSKINNGPYDTQNSELGISGFTIGTGSTWGNVNSTAPGINFSAWNHIVAAYNSMTGVVKICINGVCDSSSIPSYVDVTTTPIYAGARPFWSGTGGTSFYFRGAIDDIHIYNYSISSATIDSLYNYNPISTSIGDINNSKLNVYPNPSDGLFYFNGPDPVIIYNKYGVEVLQARSRVDLSNYENGMYFYTSGKSTGKIVLVR